MKKPRTRSGVAQIFNLLYRRIVFCGRGKCLSRSGISSPADSKSAIFTTSYVAGIENLRCGTSSRLRLRPLRFIFLILLVASVAAFAQRWGRRGWGGDDFNSPTWTEGGDTV